MQPRTQVLLLAAANFVFAGCATSSEAVLAGDAAQTQLSAQGDADSLAASALFARLNRQLEASKSAVLSAASAAAALDLAARAVAAAPDRPYLVLEQLQLCQEVPSCNSQALESRLQELDPENGIPWMYALLRAQSANDPEAVRRARTGMARAQRMDWHWTETVSHLTQAVTGIAGINADQAFLDVLGIESALMTPLQPVAKACAAQEIQQPEVLAQCRQIADEFRQGDIYIFEMYGTSLGRRFWPEGSVEWAQIAAERRRAHYWQDVWSHHLIRLNSKSSSRIQATLYAQYPTEQQVFRALYLRLGFKPDPPAGWIDKTPGG